MRKRRKESSIERRRASTRELVEHVGGVEEVSEKDNVAIAKLIYSLNHDVGKTILKALPRDVPHAHKLAGWKERMREEKRRGGRERELASS